MVKGIEQASGVEDVALKKLSFRTKQSVQICKIKPSQLCDIGICNQCDIYSQNKSF